MKSVVVNNKTLSRQQGVGLLELASLPVKIDLGFQVAYPTSSRISHLSITESELEHTGFIFASSGHAGSPHPSERLNRCASERLHGDILND